MAILFNPQSGERIRLRSHHSFGRLNTHTGHSQNLDTAFDDKSVSKNHATIRWNGSAWLINDNNSTNGTWLNSKLVADWQVLNIDDEISFRPDETWQVICIDQPKSLLQGLTAQSEDIFLDGMRELPTFEDNKAWVFKAKEDQWVLAYGNNERVLSDGEIVVLPPSYSWRFQLEDSVDETLNISKPFSPHFLNKFLFIFKVSQDLKHTFLSIEFGDLHIELGERVTHNLLLVLCDKKLADRANEVDEEEQGWFDLKELQNLLDLEYCHLNTSIWRAKKQFKDIMLKKLDSNLSEELEQIDLFERRLGSIRVSFDNIKIIRSGLSVKSAS